MFAICVRFDLRDDEAAKLFDQLTAEVIEHIRADEPGTLLYVTNTINDTPLARVFYEVYADEDAWRTHNESDHVQAFHARKDPLVVARRAERMTPGWESGLPR